MESWWSKPEIYRSLQAYHEKHARQPSIEKHKRIHTTIINSIRDRLIKEKKCKRVEYTGSAYEGVQIGPEVEFDVMFVMDGSKLDIQSTESAEHFYLKTQPDFSWGVDKKYEKFIDSTTRKMITERFKDAFFGTLDVLIKELHLGYKTVLRRNGPAIQLDVYESHSDRKPLYNVDLVPCFENGRRQFVAKPVGDNIRSSHRDLFWRESFSMQENDFFRSADDGNGCRKKIIRLLKSIKQRESPLQSLTSYHFKTALMVLCKRNNDREHWKQTNLVQRLIDILAYLEECAQKECMDHFFFGKKCNLFAKMSGVPSQNIYHRIRRIRQNEHIFLQVIRQ